MRIRCSFFLAQFAGLAMLLSACGGGSYVQKTQDKPSNYYHLATHSDQRFAGETQPAAALHENACLLLDNRPHWRTALQAVKTRWQLEPWFILAFLHQESRFNPTAMSTSRAYGFAQIKDDSWDWYLLKTGNTGGSRERFDDAVDFIGFYANQNVKRNGVLLNDVKKQYLAYHEGMGGYERKTHLGKPWLLEVSDKVAARAIDYQMQLMDCPL